jgi:hypothetical protein
MTSALTAFMLQDFKSRSFSSSIKNLLHPSTKRVSTT